MNKSNNIILTIEDIIKAKNNNEDSLLLIFNKFSGLIDKYARSYHLKNYDYDDLKQEGYMAIVSAVNKYNLDKGLSSFNGYIITTIKNLYAGLARGNIRFNEESSLDLVIDGELNLIDLIEDTSNDANIEMNYIYCQDKEKIVQAINSLPPYEKDLLNDLYYKYKGSLLKYCTENSITYYIGKKKLNNIIYKIRKEL